MILKEVTTTKELKAFIHFQNELYKDCPYFVPPLEHGELKMIQRHPAKSFCEMRMWLAYKDNQIVGRIAGIINRKCNQLKNQKRIRFGWFDVIDDIEVAKALTAEVEKWGQQEQLTEICGPSRFSNMEKQALLIEGFDKISSIATDYNYDYYPRLLAQLGFEKEVDYVQYKVKVKEVPERIENINRLLAERYHIHLKKFKNKTELKEKGKEFFEVVNESYQHVFNFIPLTDEEIAWTIDENFSIAILDLVSVLEDQNGKIVGIAFCLPSLSRAFQKAKGKLNPYSGIQILKALKNNDLVDMFLTGVLPQYYNTGIHTIYHSHLNKVFLSKGYRYALCSQQLEDNTAVRIWGKYDAELYSRRRCYKKEINTPSEK